MLTQESKQILDYAIPIFESGVDTLEIAQIQKETGLSLLEVNSAIDYLTDQEYFKIKDIQGSQVSILWNYGLWAHRVG